jgi:hypothetical protein
MFRALRARVRELSGTQFRCLCRGWVTIGFECSMRIADHLPLVAFVEKFKGVGGEFKLCSRGAVVDTSLRLQEPTPCVSN